MIHNIWSKLWNICQKKQTNKWDRNKVMVWYPSSSHLDLKSQSKLKKLLDWRGPAQRILMVMKWTQQTMWDSIIQTRQDQRQGRWAVFENWVLRECSQNSTQIKRKRLSHSLIWKWIVDTEESRIDKGDKDIYEVIMWDLPLINLKIKSKDTHNWGSCFYLPNPTVGDSISVLRHG